MAETISDKIDIEQLRQFQSLELLSRQVVEGFIVGLHKSPFHGFSVEFAEHRLYNPGESTRHIDWKLYGRTDRLFVKRYEEETNLRCQLVIDDSSSMYFPNKEYNKLKFSVYSAAAIIQMLKKQRDAAGLTFFSNEIESYFPARSSNVHIKLLYNEMEKRMSRGEEQRKSAAAESLHQIAERINKRSLVIIFSDMLDNVSSKERMFSALQHLKYNGHEVILFHVVDKAKELDFNYENRPYLFVDMETGEKIKLYPNDVREKYLQSIGAYRDEVKMKCNQYKIDYVEADINKGFRQILLPYLMKRIRMK